VGEGAATRFLSFLGELLESFRHYMSSEVKQVEEIRIDPVSSRTRIVPSFFLFRPFFPFFLQIYVRVIKRRFVQEFFNFTVLRTYSSYRALILFEGDERNFQKRTKRDK